MKVILRMRKLIDSLKKYNNKNWCIYAFILGMLCYFITLSYCQLVFANYLYLEGDNIEIYAPISVQIANSIRCFNTPFYSFSYFLGHNASGLIASYGQIFSLTFWLILIFKNIDPAVLIFLSMVIRAGFSCMTFQIYASENLNKNRFICLLCSICYCMCSFQFAILEINQIWMDAFWLLPLIIIFIRKLVDEKKWIPLTVCYFYLFVTNFYMGYIVGIFSFIYFLSYIFIVKNIKFKQIIKDFLRFSFAVILAISLSSFLLLPAANYFLNAPLAKSLENFSLEINLLDVINAYSA